MITSPTRSIPEFILYFARACMVSLIFGIVIGGAYADTITSPIRSFVGHTNGIRSVAYSPDGTQVLTGSTDGTAKLWAASGSIYHTFEGHFGAVNSVAFSPDNQHILIGAWNITVNMLTKSGDIYRTFSGHTAIINSVVFSSDGTQVLTGSSDKTAKLWDASTEKLIRTFRGQQTSINSVAFSPDGALVLAGLGDGTAKLWDASTGAVLRTFVDTLARNSVSSVAFSPDGTQVLAALTDGTARLWETDTGTEIRTFTANSAAIRAIAFSPDGTQVLTGSVDRTARLWDAGTGREIRSFKNHTNSVLSVAFSPDGMYVLTGAAAADNTAKLWPRSINTCFDLCADETLDTDEDGLIDCVELCNNTNPNEPDSDFDGLPDLWEVENGTDPGVDDAEDDPDDDGATNLAEFDAGTDPFDPDTDDDGITDGYEIDNGLDPLADDADSDLDEDGLSNLEEFERGTAANDPNDPPDAIFVSNSGSDATGDGSSENPFSTIAFAMDFASVFSDLHPVTLRLAPGSYSELVVFVQNVSVEGEDPTTTFIVPELNLRQGAAVTIVKAAPQSALIGCTVTVPLSTTTNIILARIDDVIMTIENVHLDGTIGLADVTGVFVTGAGSAGSSISDSVLRNLERGVHTVDSNVNITRNTFVNIQRDAVFIGFTSKGSAATPLLGIEGDIVSTGFNRFSDVDDNFIKYDNADSALTLAQFNDWGVFTEAEILAKLSVPAKVGVDQIIVTPFLGQKLLANTLVIRLLDDGTGETIPTAASASVTVGVLNGEYDAASKLIRVTPIDPGMYSVDVEAVGYDSRTVTVEVSQSITASDIELVNNGTHEPQELRAEFTATPKTGPPLLQVQFADLSDDGGESIETWDWDFGDASSSSVQNPIHLYLEGVYDVSLTVTNASGQSTESKTTYIIADNSLPALSCNSGPQSSDTALARLGDLLTLLAAGILLSLLRRQSRERRDANRA